MKKAKNKKKFPSSFRDPSGFVFSKNGEIFRQVNLIYKEHYNHLIQSGLYNALVKKNLLIPHKEVDGKLAFSDDVYKVIKPQLIPFVSYPYEWSFSQLKDAALTTIKIQKTSLKYEMSLKDASAFNIQFVKGKPLLIDTLSFEKYKIGQPWVAYKQFCQYFLAPLALMSYKDVSLNQLLRVHLDGIPLDLASTLLPLRTYLEPSLFFHIHLHAKSQKFFASKLMKIGTRKMNRQAFITLIKNLEFAIKKLQWKQGDSEWGEYYKKSNYSSEAFARKEKLVDQFLNEVQPKTVWDFGANIGEFSRIASRKGIQVISFDKDPVAVEKNYLECVKSGEANILPLFLDLTNPSPGIGWGSQERQSLLERGPTDTILALALIHHLAISNNLPFSDVARFFSELCHSLVVEFVPKSDSQVQRMLSTRKDIFSDYNQKNFEKEFGKFFKIKRRTKIKDSERILYLMVRL